MCKFNPMAFAYSNKFDCKQRPGMAGVRHEDGYKIASDAHILCAIKESYPEELEGKTLLKDGTTTDARFPKWRDVVPGLSSLRYLNPKGYESFKIDLKKIKEFSKDAKQLKKDDMLMKPCPVYVKIREVYFKLDLFEKIVSLMRHIGTDEINIKSGMFCGYVSNNGNYGLIMPIYFHGDCENQMIEGVYTNRVYTLV